MASNSNCRPILLRIDQFSKVVLESKGKDVDDPKVFESLRSALQVTGYAEMKLSALEIERIAKQIHLGSGMVNFNFLHRGSQCSVGQVHSDIRVPDSFEMNSRQNMRRRRHVKVFSLHCLAPLPPLSNFPPSGNT